jgi:hypothetical protein
MTAAALVPGFSSPMRTASRHLRDQLREDGLGALASIEIFMGSYR